MADPFYDFVELRLPLDSSGGFEDQSFNFRWGVVHGGISLSTAVSKFGGASAAFDGVDDALIYRLNNSEARWLVNEGESWTVEFWAFVTGPAGAHYFMVDAGGAAPGVTNTGGFAIAVNAARNIVLTVSDGTGTFPVELVSSSAVLASTWHYITAQYDAATREYTLFIDGVVVGSVIRGAIVASPMYGGATIGFDTGIVFGADTAETAFFQGHIDDVRITRGAVRYDGTFAPPAAALPTDWDIATDPLWADVVFIPTYDDSSGSVVVTDNSQQALPVAVSGGVTYDALNTFSGDYGRGAVVFDGVDGYMSIPIPSALAADKPWTFELSWDTFAEPAAGQTSTILSTLVAPGGVKQGLRLWRSDAGAVTLSIWEAGVETQNTYVTDDPSGNNIAFMSLGDGFIWVFNNRSGEEWLGSAAAVSSFGGSTLYFGADAEGGTPQRFWAGSIGQIRITAAQRYWTDVYSSPVPGIYQPIVAGNNLSVALPLPLVPRLRLDAVFRSDVSVSVPGPLAFMSAPTATLTASTPTVIPAEAASVAGARDGALPAWQAFLLAVADAALEDVQVTGLRIRERAEAGADWATYRLIEQLITDTAGVALALEARSALLVHDSAAASVLAQGVAALRLADRAAAQGGFGTRYQGLALVAEYAQASPAARAAFAQFLGESAQAGGALDFLTKLFADITEQAEAASSVQAFLGIGILEIARADAADGVVATAQYIAEVLERGTAAITLRFDDELFTAWVMNTEGSRAVSRYTDYRFNSFAMLEGGMYAASDEGLYLLGGDTDDGDVISAGIRTLMLSFGTSRQKRVRSAYVGYTSTGRLLLKVRVVEQGELIEHWFEGIDLPANAPREQRIPVAMGLRSRYWQFELVNVDGADFEIDELELHPLVLQRRV